MVITLLQGKLKVIKYWYYNEGSSTTLSGRKSGRNIGNFRKWVYIIEYLSANLRSLCECMCLCEWEREKYVEENSTLNNPNSDLQHHVVTWQRLGKHIPAEANARNNRKFITKQRISKHASLTLETMFSAWSVRSGYEEVFIRRD
jgi:hypothetical protein